MSYKRVVIIGAPRSGTNMLRDVLSALPGVATWPCDEINYIWRHGNVRYPSDEFTTDMATPDVKRYLGRCFDHIARKYSAHTVVEKTCANSLRVSFVRRVLPDAKYIVIRRDGVDAAVSALNKWRAGIDIRYIARKAYYVPLSDMPYHAFSLSRNLIGKMFASEQRISKWGPILSDMDNLLCNYSLAQVCMIQWQRCVDRTDEALKEIDRTMFHEVKYEAFVRNPLDELVRIANFLDLSAPRDCLGDAVGDVSDESVGKGARSIDQQEGRRLRYLARHTLSRHGYSYV